MSNQTILITGATDGVGRRVAERLAKPGRTLLVHGRDQARGESLVLAIRDQGAQAKFYRADLASLEEVRGLAEEITREHIRLDVLVNNAGIGSGGPSAGRAESNGIELRFAVNYLAGFLLTRLLLSKLKATPAARIVNVSSLGQQAIDFDDVMITRGYSGSRAYCQSKLAQILFTIDLAAELKAEDVTVNALHPATYMDTTMVRTAGAKPISTVDEGADAILNLVGSPELAGQTGFFFDRLQPARANAQAYDAAARARLRTLSFALSRLSNA